MSNKIEAANLSRLPDVNLLSRQLIPVEMRVIVPDDYGLMALLTENGRRESLKKAVGILEGKIFGTLPGELAGKRFLIERSLELIGPNEVEKEDFGVVQGVVLREKGELSNFSGSVGEVINPNLFGKMRGVNYQSMPYYEAIVEAIGENVNSMAPRRQILVLVANGTPVRSEINPPIMNALLRKLGPWSPEIWVLPMVRGNGVRVDLDSGENVHRYWQNHPLGDRYGVIPVYAKPEFYENEGNKGLILKQGRLNLATLFEK